MKYVLYKITNTLNFMIYIGVHATEDINDNYMGSGSKIKEAIKNIGPDNFRKEILFIFDNKEEMLLKERELVNIDFILREDTYNIVVGGDGYHALGMIAVKDINNNISFISVEDKRYLNGELVYHTKGNVTVKDKEGNFRSVSVNDEEYLNGELKHNLTGMFVVQDKNKNTYCITKDDERWKSGELTSIHKNKVTVRDKDGKFLSVNKNDPRYLSGELVHHSKGRKQIHNKRLDLRKTVLPNELNKFLNDGWELGYK